MANRDFAASSVDSPEAADARETSKSLSSSSVILRTHRPHFMEDHAYALIVAGWPIFPCNGKVPLLGKKDGGNGHLDATLDDRQVEEYWTKYPTANIGCRPPEWMIVIDLDPRHGGTFERLVEAAGAITPTLHSFSGRGDGGMHLIYDRDGFGEITRHRLPDGIDVKDHDGYIVLPPSIHPEPVDPASPRYRWGNRREIATLPPGLRQLLTLEPQSSRSWLPRPRRCFRR